MAVVFLDIDGAVSSLSSRHAFGDGRVRNFDGYHLNLSRRLGRRLASLEAELLWLTTWGARANEIGRLMGLPPLEVAAEPPPGASSAGSWKLEAVRARVEDNPQPFVWVDDDAIDGAAEAWAAGTKLRSLLVRPRPNRGLSPREVDVIEDFCGPQLPLGLGGAGCRSGTMRM